MIFILLAIKTIYFYRTILSNQKFLLNSFYPQQQDLFNCLIWQIFNHTNSNFLMRNLHFAVPTLNNVIFKIILTILNKINSNFFMLNINFPVPSLNHVVFKIILIITKKINSNFLMRNLNFAVPTLNNVVLFPQNFLLVLVSLVPDEPEPARFAATIAFDLFQKNNIN